MFHWYLAFDNPTLGCVVMVFWSDENSAEVGTNLLSKNLGLFFLTLPFQRTKHSHLPGEANPTSISGASLVSFWEGRSAYLWWLETVGWKKHISLTKMFQIFILILPFFLLFVHHPLKKKHPKVRTPSLCSDLRHHVEDEKWREFTNVPKVVVMFSEMVSSWLNHGNLTGPPFQCFLRKCRRPFLYAKK